MFLFGVSLFKLFSNFEKPAKKVGEFTGEVLEKSKEEYEKQKRIRDREEQKEGSSPKSKTKDVDPARIVSDFFASGDVSEEEVFAVGKKSKRNQTIKKDADDNTDNPELKKADDKNVVENNIFSFSELVRKPVSENDIIENEDVTLSDDTTIESQDKEKLKPLSKKESQALLDSLDNAVASVQQIEYKLPPLDCLNRPKPGSTDYSEAELQSNGEKLIAALGSFNVSASIVGVVPGPTVTRYELSPAPGVKISKFVGLADDLALHMAAPAGLRIEAPIPNKAAIGIEIPNRSKTTVTFREIIDTDKFRNAGSKLTVALGKDISGTPIYSNLAKMPHLLVAGTTGSGKSVCLNSMIVSLLYNASPDEVKILLIDPKQVEFGVYNGLPHLLVPVVSDPRKASGALGWAVTEMLSRYKTLNANGVRDISAYNSLCEEREDLTKMSHIVIFIDELADLMTVAPAEVEDAIQRLAQMARAAGMHLVVATQRPSVDVITGVIKANIPSRIALTVKSQVDSRTIIDSAGAEKLMGNGDMLYYPVGIPKPIRVQGCYLSDSEIENVVSFIKANSSSNYDDSVQQEIDRQAVSEKKKASSDDNTASGGVDANDELLMRAIELFVGAPEKASISALQRHLGLGFAKAGRLMDTLEQKGIVGPHMGSKPRNVLVTKAQWYEMNALNSSQQTQPEKTDEEDVYFDTETE
ncbi:MAG: DNA translocase FtsK [Ruminococcaceae bacterium]|nr:DNA translocase FtsK [Oscillospiraceae bacterium]